MLRVTDDSDRRTHLISFAIRDLLTSKLRYPTALFFHRYFAGPCFGSIAAPPPTFNIPHRASYADVVHLPGNYTWCDAMFGDGNFNNRQAKTHTRVGNCPNAIYFCLMLENITRLRPKVEPTH
jgi:hypothetical protein